MNMLGYCGKNVGNSKSMRMTLTKFMQYLFYINTEEPNLEGPDKKQIPKKKVQKDLMKKDQEQKDQVRCGSTISRKTRHRR